MEVGGKTVDDAMMNQEIRMPIIISKRANIPFPDRLSFVEQRSLEFIRASNSLARSITGAGVFVLQIISMHEHYIFTCSRATEHFRTFAHAIGSHAPIGLLIKGDTLKMPVYQII